MFSTSSTETVGQERSPSWTILTQVLGGGVIGHDFFKLILGMFVGTMRHQWPKILRSIFWCHITTHKSQTKYTTKCPVGTHEQLPYIRIQNNRKWINQRPKWLTSIFRITTPKCGYINISTYEPWFPQMTIKGLKPTVHLGKLVIIPKTWI